MLSDRDPGRTVTATGASRVEISNGAGDQTRVEFDPATGLPNTQSYPAIVMAGAAQQVVETYSDWRAVDGIRVPFHVVAEVGGRKNTDLTVSDYKFNTGIKPEELSQKP